jgi:hypothetical protein
MRTKVDRPGGDGPVGKVNAGGADASTSTLPGGSEVAAQLRRRRLASYRVPPLADGRRDPLDLPGRGC